MTTLLAAALLGLQGSPPVPAVSAAKLIGAMFQRYSEANTLSGTIRLVQSSMDKSLEVDTQLAFEKPSFLFLAQRQTDDRRKPASAVSDGVQWAYTPPVTLINAPPKLVESLHKKNGEVTIPEMYGTFKKGLLDQSAVLDIAFARPADLKYLVWHLVSFTNGGKQQIGDRTVNVIKGKWRDFYVVDGQPNAEFEMDLSDAGDLVRMVTTAHFAVDPGWLQKNHMPANAYPNGVEATSVWDVNLAVNQPVDHSVFHL